MVSEKVSCSLRLELIESFRCSMRHSLLYIYIAQVNNLTAHVEMPNENDSLGGILYKKLVRR